MKKSRVFMGVAALSLVVAGVFANKTAKKFVAAPNLYYKTGTSTYGNVASPGCLLSIFTTTRPSGANIARVEEGASGPYSLYYYHTTAPMGYYALYNAKF